MYRTGPFFKSEHHSTAEVFKFEVKRLAEKIAFTTFSWWLCIRSLYMQVCISLVPRPPRPGNEASTPSFCRLRYEKPAITSFCRLQYEKQVITSFCRLQYGTRLGMHYTMLHLHYVNLQMTPCLTSVGFSLCFGTIMAKMARILYISRHHESEKKCVRIYICSDQIPECIADAC